MASSKPAPKAAPKPEPQAGTILLTSANGSLGSAIAAQIASTPDLAGEYHRLYTARDAKAAPALQAALLRGHGTAAATSSSSHDILSLNTADLASVREVAAQINARVTSICSYETASY
ncbi:hypothetical protein B0T17DRAFT_618291 [Bombardia bombarda]|uniref:Uncharacterized protein n=1 Tax=Bombardia bombarda TaxID=252184 RepID=A0AA39WUM7_9PEZI|nr:hypothetical protein B0T17DRAFT_618291 [Bombardia bombarda]